MREIIEKAAQAAADAKFAMTDTDFAKRAAERLRNRALASDDGILRLYALEAANELDRLRAENASLAQEQHAAADRYAAKLAEAEAEAARLREAANEGGFVLPYIVPGAEFAATDQTDVWQLIFSDPDCGNQWFGGEGYAPGEARAQALEAWHRYAPAWSIRLMRTVTMDEVARTALGEQHAKG